MKSNADRVLARLTLTPEVDFTLEKDGFIGALYKPMRDGYPRKAVTVKTFYDRKT